MSGGGHGGALRVVDCGKTFADDTRALAPVTLEISQGRFVSLIGPSGCGKSTIFNIVAGLLVWPRADGARLGLLGERGARAVWAVLWLGAAVLWLFPSNYGANALHDAFAGAPSGAGWLSSVHSSATSAVAGSGSTLALLLAIASAAIGVAAIWVGVLLTYDSFYWPPAGKGWPPSFFVVALIVGAYLITYVRPSRTVDRSDQLAKEHTCSPA